MSLTFACQVPAMSYQLIMTDCKSMQRNQQNAPALKLIHFFPDFVLFFLSCLESARCTESTHETWSAVKQCSHYWGEASGSMAAPIFE
jgi:hypothetical protein